MCMCMCVCVCILLMKLPEILNFRATASDCLDSSYFKEQPHRKFE